MKNLVLCLGLICLGLNGVSATVSESGVTQALTPATQDLFKAVQSGDLDAVNSAIERGASLNERNADGLRPLDCCLLFAHDADVMAAEHGLLSTLYAERNKTQYERGERELMNYYRGIADRHFNCAEALKSRGASTDITVVPTLPFHPDTNLAGMRDLTYIRLSETDRARLYGEE